MPVPRFTADVDPSAVVAALSEQGCAIVERLASPELCDRVEGELGPHVARTPTGPDDFSGRSTRRTGALLARSPSAVELVAHPLVLGAVDGVLGTGRSRYQLHLTQAIAIGPGSPAQPLHRDQWCFDFHPFPVELDVEVSTIWALTEFTAANGATRLVPASHRSEGQPYRDEDAEPAVMARGSVVLYLGSTVHGGGANITADVRTGVNVDYSLAWLRQEENQYLSVPLAVAAALPEPVQRLMGYALGAYALGYVDDVRDPIAVLRPDAADDPSFAPR